MKSNFSIRSRINFDTKLLFTSYTNTKGWSGASSPLKTDNLAFVCSGVISILKLNTLLR